jgi:general transcriptional corepressor CYC8
MRAPPQRQPSPRQEPPRHYPEPSRHTPARKPMSPSPKMNSAVPSMYAPGPQNLPQLNGPDRNAQNYNQGARAPPQTNGTPVNGNHAAPPQGPLPPYGRPFSPPNELRPLRDDRPPSPGPGYHHQPQHYNHNFPGASSMAAGAPVPPPVHQMPEPTPRDNHERPPSAMKRHREWEPDSGPSKKAANDETRARLDDHSSRRATPPGRVLTPRDSHRRSSSEIRRENQRIADQNYHPSEAAHHPAPLAPPPQHQHQHPGPPTPQSQHPPHMPSMNTIYDAAKEERKDPVEGAARKVNVDENYDDDGDDEKKPMLSNVRGGSGRSSPRGMVNVAGQPKTESISA